LHTHIGDLADHVGDSVKVLVVAGISPCSTHAEAGASSLLGPGGCRQDGVAVEHLLGIHRGLVSGRLGAIGAILGTSSGLDGKQGADLNFTGVVVLPVNRGGPVDQFKQGGVVNLFNFLTSPVCSNFSHDICKCG